VDRRKALVQWLLLEEQRQRAFDVLGAGEHDPASVVQPDLEVLTTPRDHA
jgi:hypothetical protein